MPACSQREHGGLGHLDVVNGQVDVELLRALTGGPGGRGVVVGLLEGEAVTGLGFEDDPVGVVPVVADLATDQGPVRSEEHTSELQSLMRISYAVFCLKKKKHNINQEETTNKEQKQTYKQRK